MLRLAGIPISDLTNLTEAQRNSQEFQDNLDVFNKFKQTASENTIPDSVDVIAEEDKLLLINVLALMLTHDRDELPIVTSKDIDIYVKLLLGNLTNMFDVLESSSSSDVIDLQYIPPTEIDFNTINHNQYNIFVKKDPEWMKHIHIEPRLRVINYDTSYSYSDDAFMDFAKYSKLEQAYPIFGLTQKNYITALDKFYTITLGDISASDIPFAPTSIQDAPPELYPYDFSIANPTDLARKLTKKLSAPIAEFSDVIQTQGAMSTFLVELYNGDVSYDYDTSNQIETHTLSVDNIYEIINTIDLMKDWRYG